ncbi:MAG TPA: hypothetical protein VNT75_20845 [Symbiobacteriaceae bacterium]|nr:hypothetical protein [Symbiobacteriaceae bacterium]
MRKADETDLRDALSEEVETLEPSDELWNNIYKRSVAKQEKKRVPWLTSALAMGAAAAAAAVFLLNGQWNRAPEPGPTVDPGPVTLVAPGGPTPELTSRTPGVQRFAAPDAPTDRLFVLYNHTMYWYNGESVPPAELGDLLTLTTKGSGDGYTNLLEAGQEVRAIKGADPVRRIAVHTSQGWYVLDSLATDAPNN